MSTLVFTTMSPPNLNSALTTPNVTDHTIISRYWSRHCFYPTFDWTQILPLCNSTMSLAMDKPRPVPSIFSAVMRSNLSKILSLYSSGMPGPVSEISKYNSFSLAISFIPTSPPAVSRTHSGKQRNKLFYHIATPKKHLPFIRSRREPPICAAPNVLRQR
jgi:hypothetical protein